MRDAITAIHNLETLLKSPRVGVKVVADVLPEVWAGAAVLRGTFTSVLQGATSQAALAARSNLVWFTVARLDELERAMRSSANDIDVRTRLSLEQVVMRVSVDLDACTELLDLAERAEHAVPTELALAELGQVAMRSKARRAERELPVRLVLDKEDCVLRADPHVFKRLLTFAVARAHAAGAAAVTLRLRCAVERASIEIGPTATGELTLPALPMRLMRRIEPTDAVVDAAAQSASIDSRVNGGSITLSVPRVV